MRTEKTTRRKIDLYRFIGKVDYDRSWLIEPESDRPGRTNKDFSLRELDKKRPHLGGERFEVQVRRDFLKKMQDEQPGEPQSRATKFAYDAMMKGEDISIMTSTDTVTRGRNVIYREYFTSYSSTKPSILTLDETLYLLHGHPNSFIFELTEGGEVYEDEPEEDLSEEVPKPSPKKKSKASK